MEATTRPIASRSGAWIAPCPFEESLATILPPARPADRDLSEGFYPWRPAGLLRKGRRPRFLPTRGSPFLAPVETSSGRRESAQREVEGGFRQSPAFGGRVGRLGSDSVVRRKPRHCRSGLRVFRSTIGPAGDRSRIGEGRAY